MHFLLYFSLTLHVALGSLLAYHKVKNEHFVLLHRSAQMWTLPSIEEGASPIEEKITTTTFGAIDFDPAKVFKHQVESPSKSNLYVVEDVREELNPLFLIDTQSRHRMPGEYRWVLLESVKDALAVCLSPLNQRYNVPMVLEPLDKAILLMPADSLFLKQTGPLVVTPEPPVAIVREDYYIGSWLVRTKNRRDTHMYLNRTDKTLSAHHLGQNLADKKAVEQKITALGCKLPIDNTLTHFEVSEYLTDNKGTVTLRVLHLYSQAFFDVEPAGDKIKVSKFHAALLGTDANYSVDPLTKHLINLPGLSGINLNIFKSPKAAGVLSVREAFGTTWVMLVARSYHEGGWANVGGLIDPEDFEDAKDLDAYLVNAVRETKEESFHVINMDVQKAKKECATVSLYSSYGGLYTYFICPQTQPASSEIIRKASTTSQEHEEAYNFLWVSLDDMHHQAQAWNPNELPNLLLKNIQVLNADDSGIIRMDVRPFRYMVPFLHQLRNLKQIAHAVVTRNKPFSKNDAFMSMDYTYQQSMEIGAVMVDLENERIGLVPSPANNQLFHIPKIPHDGSGYHYCAQAVTNLINNKAFFIGKWSSINHLHPAITYDYQQDTTVGSVTVFLLEMTKCEKMDPAVRWFNLSSIQQAQDIAEIDRRLLTSVAAKEFMNNWRRVFFPTKSKLACYVEKASQTFQSPTSPASIQSQDASDTLATKDTLKELQDANCTNDNLTGSADVNSAKAEHPIADKDTQKESAKDGKKVGNDLQLSVILGIAIPLTAIIISAPLIYYFVVRKRAKSSLSPS